MTAEIATMKVNEQIDAMKVMAVDPIGYLASPRVLGAIIMMPLLSALFLLCGVLSSYIIGVWLFNVDVGVFLEKIKWITKPTDVLGGFQKAAIFGAFFSLISTYIGFRAQSNAKGVGLATTKAVVISLVVILVSDFFISYLQMSRIW